MTWRIWTLREITLLALLIGFLSAYLVQFSNTTIGCSLGVAQADICSKHPGR
jgi:hypothetical protein